MKFGRYCQINLPHDDDDDDDDVDDKEPFFVVWLTYERGVALFPAGNIVRDSHHREFPSCHKQDLNMDKNWVYDLVNEVAQ